MEAPTTMVVAREGLPLWRRLASRLAVTFLAITTLGILLTGYLEHRELKQDFQRVIGGFLLNIARAGALLLDGDQHQAVVTKGRNNTPAYGAIRAQIQRIEHAKQLEEPVYRRSSFTGADGLCAVR